MKKSLKIYLFTIGTVVLVCSVTLTLLYVRFGARSENEIWRMTDYSAISSLTIVDKVLFFEGYKKDNSVDCRCVYAVDKITGQLIWSTEQLALPYINKKEISEAWNWQGMVDLVSVSPKDYIVYITINHDTLYALGLADGHPIWKIEGINGLNLFDDNFSDSRFFVIDKQGNLLVLDKFTGDKLWEQPIYQDLENESAYATFQKNLLFVGADFADHDELMAFNPDTGKIFWETEVRSIWRPQLFSEMIISDNTDNWDNGRYLAGFKISTGEKVWELLFEEQSFYFTQPPANKRYIYLVLDKNDNNFQRIARLKVLDVQTGKVLWQFNDDFAHGDISYFVTNDTVFVGTESGYVFALDGNTGQEIWKTFTAEFPSYFILDEDKLIVAFEEHGIVALDIETGITKWTAKLNTETILPQGRYNDQKFIIRRYKGTLYITTEEPAVYAVNSNNGEVLWSWAHNPFFREHRGYTLELLDDGIIYIIGGNSPFDIAGYGLFAIKAEP